MAYANWTYAATFNADASLLQHKTIQLVSLGIDTIADLDLNGVNIYSAHNMFQRVRLDVARHLVSGDNTLVVRFRSKVVEAAKAMEVCSPAEDVNCPIRTRPFCQHGFDNVNYLRTEQCSFSWDWGPA